METIIQMIEQYGIETIILALAINILTGITKIPFKQLAHKMKNSEKVTKYITFLPVIYGFILAKIYVQFIMAESGETFTTLWIASSSLSLTIYAFMEKFIPNKNTILKQNEIDQNKELIEEIKQIYQETQLSKEPDNAVEKKTRIILRGDRDATIEKK